MTTAKKIWFTVAALLGVMLVGGVVTITSRFISSPTQAMLPVPVATPTHTPSPRPVEERVILVTVEPDAQLEHQLALVESLLVILDRLIEQQHDKLDTASADSAPVQTASAIETQSEQEKPPPPPPPWAQENLLVWESGTCWTPHNAPVARLCGDDNGDGYVVRWQNVAGDNYGGKVADADFMQLFAHDLDESTLIFSAPHPRTGQIVNITYNRYARNLFLSVGGVLAYCVDNEHNYEFMGF